jgi:hypothetical protein
MRRCFVRFLITLVILQCDRGKRETRKKKEKKKKTHSNNSVFYRENDDSILFEKNDIYILRYRDIEQYLEEGRVKLI